jgi:hypothetical protein
VKRDHICPEKGQSMWKEYKLLLTAKSLKIWVF